MSDIIYVETPNVAYFDGCDVFLPMPCGRPHEWRRATSPEEAEKAARWFCISLAERGYECTAEAGKPERYVAKQPAAAREQGL